MSIRKNIDEELTRQGLSRRQLAIRAGIKQSTLQSALDRDDNYSFEMLQKIAEVLKVPLPMLIEKFNADIVDDYVSRVIADVGLMSSREGIDAEEKEKWTLIAEQLQQVISETNDIIDIVNDTGIDKNILFKICDMLRQLNEIGQLKAVERIEELTEIAKYKKDN